MAPLPAILGTGLKSRLREAPLLLALLCLLIVIWLPRVNLPRPVHHYQITFDISQSMNVRDAGYGGLVRSRLELAKAAVQDLLRELPCGSRLGWSVFTGQRTMSLITPLEICQHFAGLSASLELVDGKMRWINGSSVGRGLHQSLRAASAIGDDVAVVLISDGHEAPPLRAGQSGIPKSEGLGIRGLLVGVGGDTPVAIPKTDAQGRQTGYWLPHEVAQKPGVPKEQSHEELSQLHAEHLIKIARLVALDYVRIQQPEDLAAALEKAQLARVAAAPVDVRWIPAGMALLLLCWRFLPALRGGLRQRRTV